jgi:hypothetical protein
MPSQLTFPSTFPSAFPSPISSANPMCNDGESHLHAQDIPSNITPSLARFRHLPLPLPRPDSGRVPSAHSDLNSQVPLAIQSSLPLPLALPSTLRIPPTAPPPSDRIGTPPALAGEMMLMSFFGGQW